MAEKAERLEPAQAKNLSAQTFTIASDDAHVEFLMEAPVEKIRGRVPSTAVTGTLHLDLQQLETSSGIVHVDLTNLELFQRNADDQGNFSQEEKNDLQNEHARAWLEIDPEAPEDQRQKNSIVEFSLQEIQATSSTNILAMTGEKRTVTFTAKGEFLLHQRKAVKSVELTATFMFTGDQVKSVEVRTVNPMAISLAEYDVRPRTAFGKLAERTLDTLSPKVAKEALVSFTFTANLNATQT